jgi:hypothetical protein
MKLIKKLKTKKFQNYSQEIIFKKEKIAVTEKIEPIFIKDKFKRLDLKEDLNLKLENTTPIVHFDEENIRTTIFSNNLKIQSVENFSPIATITVVIKAGPRYENPSERGLSILFSKLLFKETQNISEEEVIFYITFIDVVYS